MTDPNPLREDEIELAIQALRPFVEAANQEERMSGHDGPLGAYVAYADLCAARAAILRLDQVREGRGK